MAFPLISVVIPIYNAELFLKECIASVLAQDYPSIEIILVNDGSTDQSKDICDYFAQKYDLCKVIHQSNQGVSKARSNGVLHAQGTWISFVDADDTLPVTALSSLYQAVDSLSDKLIIGKLNTLSSLPTNLSSPNEFRKAIILGEIYPAPYGKIIHRSLFDNTIFDVPRNLRIGEDLVMNLRLSRNLDFPPKIIDQVVYHYRSNPSSITNTTSRSLDLLFAYDIEIFHSIPQEDYHVILSERIKQREVNLLQIALSNNLHKEWKKHPWIELVLEDAKKNNYRFHWKTKLLLATRSPFFLQCYVYGLKILRRMHLVSLDS